MSPKLPELLGSLPCRCGRCRKVATERVRVTRQLAEALCAELAATQGAVLFGDPRTLAACGHALASALRARGCTVTVVDLETPGGALHADAAGAERASVALRAADDGALPVAVGSGTINDLVKAAAHAAGRPYVAVATAASMNGYTSAIAAITEGGLKRTLPARPPVAVLAAPDVLSRAPRRMAVSGLADLLSKPVSSADWRLAHLLWDEPHCPEPSRIAGAAVGTAATEAEGVGRGEPRAVRKLFEALLVSGISMATAGSSAPASGGEHLISHFLDMAAAADPEGPRTPALHGEQVGVATRVSANLYRALLAAPEDRVAWRHAAESAPGAEDVAVALDAAPWLPSPLRDRFLEEGRRKLERLGDAGHRVNRIRARWSELRSVLIAELGGIDACLAAAVAAGAPRTAADLGVSEASFRTAYRLARFVRDRYTVLDLGGDLGLLHALEPRVLPA